MSENLCFYLFGPFEASQGGHFLTNQDWRSKQTRAICKILLARQDQVVSSDQFIDILWPEESVEIARRRLHVRISQLRTALGNKKPLVQTVDGGYIFTPDADCWLDINEFQTAITQGQRFFENGQSLEAINYFEQARKLYRGEFLAEDLYLDWTLPLREFYRERFLSLLIELSECYAQQGRYRLAIARCREALTLDPFREIIYKHLMLYHYYAGERTQSLQAYERCCKILSEELDVEAVASTHRLADQIRAGTLWANADAPRYPPPMYEGKLFDVPFSLSETPFVGRDREYAWLVEHWKNLDTRIILLEGFAGIGKTRLAETFTGYIAANGAQVLRARIAPGEHSPYAPLISALQPLLQPKNLNKLSPTRLSALSVLFPENSWIVFKSSSIIDLACCGRTRTAL